MLGAERLKPFWRYYGGKYRAAPKYPPPQCSKIIEPFAGAAGYSLRYPDLDVTLIDKYPVIAGIWRYLIASSAAEIRRIPEVESLDDLPSWVPQEACWLVGFWMNTATTSPRRNLSSGRRKLAALGRRFEGWTEATKERIASQLGRIRHWKIIEGEYRWAPDVKATWFIDPPYSNRAGDHYVYRNLDYVQLAAWCASRQGQTIVCENEGASWLPFRPFARLKAGVNGSGSREAIWTNTTAGVEKPSCVSH